MRSVNRDAGLTNVEGPHSCRLFSMTDSLAHLLDSNEFIAGCHFTEIVVVVVVFKRGYSTFENYRRIKTVLISALFMRNWPKKKTKRKVVSYRTIRIRCCF